MEYSGRTTAYEHKGSDWRSQTIVDPKDCLQQVTFFDVQWSTCPVEVEAEVRRVWKTAELGNDRYIYRFDLSDQYQCEDYPIIAEYLKSRGQTGIVIIYYWW